MEKEELLKRGFVEATWIDEGETFTEFILKGVNFHIEISGLDLVELLSHDGWITVPNCKTIKDLDDLIRLFDLTPNPKTK